MEATLKFNLPDEKVDFEIAVKAGAMHFVLWELKQFLRDELKYNHNLSKKEIEFAEKVQSFFFESLNTNGILLDN